MSTIFRSTVLFSLLGHLTVFSIFSFSFGNKIPQADYTPTVFWGAILRSADLLPRRQQANLKPTPAPDISLLQKADKDYPPISNLYLKPAAGLTFNNDKMVFSPKAELRTELLKRKEPVIMFYPHLPYNFLLYFQDRQAVHIELMFNIISNGDTNSVYIKRKISSGNLEADLLTLRYIGHYLFIQGERFPQNKWQTVKIDLSTKND